jgi:hypothetical protein
VRLVHVANTNDSHVQPVSPEVQAVPSDLVQFKPV